MAKSLGGRNTALYRSRQQLKRMISIARQAISELPADEVAAARIEIIQMTAKLKWMDKNRKH